MSRGYKYAEGTKVTVESTQEEIRRLLVTRMKADQYAPYYDNGMEGIRFRLLGMIMQLKVPPASTEQERRRLWRCLLLHVKSMWESIQNKIATIEQVLLPYILLPDEHTVGEVLPKEIKAALDRGLMPNRLLQLPEGK